MLKRSLNLFLCCCCFYSTHLVAGISNLSKEYVEVNSSILGLKAQVTDSKLGIDEVVAKKFWRLDYNSTYDDSSLESTSSFSPDSTKTIVHSLGLSRDFNWGGHFSFANSYTDVETTATAFSAAQKQYGGQKSFTYSQDFGTNFLGRNDRIEIDIAHKNYEWRKASVDQTIETSLMGFYQNYLNVKLNRTLLVLQKEALERATKRKNLIRKRVRDGLREDVDFFQSEMAEINQKENLETVKADLDSSLKAISNQLHRDIETWEVPSLAFEEIALSQLPTGSWDSNKSNIDQKNKITYLKESLRQVKYSFMPKIELAGTYKTNSYDAARSDSISNGVTGGEFDEKIVGITVSWPIGFRPQNVAKAKMNVALKTEEMQNKKAKINFDNDLKSLQEQIAILDKNISLGQKRMVLANKVLREYNKLYNLGRADLDQVINSEESLINTQRSLTAYLIKRETMVASLAYLYGSLDGYLKGNKN